MDRIELAADQVLNEHWNYTLPVDPEKIARSMGAEIQATSGPVSGALEIRENNVLICVNFTEPMARQRFTVAHEIGHWKLGHGNSFRDHVDNFSSYSGVLAERQANQFAACLLMPRDAVLSAAASGKLNVDDMARNFRVSSIAMKYRLKNLGLIS